MKNLICILLAVLSLVSCFTIGISAEQTVISDEGRLPFEDVRQEHWFYEAVELCYANGIIKGMNEYTFGYSGQLTRAQFVTMLAGLAGIDTDAYETDRFNDVKPSHWYSGAVAWAYQDGIVSGITDTTFEPGSSLTRAQLAVIMQNYMQNSYDVEVSDDILDRYTDKPKEEYWYYDAMKFAVSSGLITGVTDDTILATGVVTRGQAAVILKNFTERYYYSFCEHNFTEATCTEPPVCTECGYVNGLPNGHSLNSKYNCKTAQKCSVCNATAEPSKFHDFAPANCGNPRICRVCGEKRGTPTGDHKELWAATCTKPAMCKTCYHTVGEPLGHTTSNGVCSRCKLANFTDTYDRTVYFIKSTGKYDPETNTYSYRAKGSIVYNRESYRVGYDYYSYFIYHISTDTIEISNVRTNRWIDDIEATSIIISRYDAKCPLVYVHYDPNGQLDRQAVGYINKPVYTMGTLPSFSNYDLGDTDVYTSRYSCGENLDIALSNFHWDLNEKFGGGLGNLGFTYYLPYIPKGETK